MITFETVNELALEVTASAGDYIFTKAGAFILGENFGNKNYQFEKVLLGPQGNPIAAAVGQLTRRFTGENLPLMKVKFQGDSVTYYANDQQHVVICSLQQGEALSVESENLLAFTSDCSYSVRFLAQGIVSQKGLATSVLRGTGPNAYVAILVDGNPLMISNMQNGQTLEADPDAVVCWMGADPGFQLDLSWKNLIGQASGESYMYQWTGDRRATVIVQPMERKSGIDISMDGRRTGQQAQRQQNQTLSGAASNVGGVIQQIGGALGGGAPQPNQQSGGLGGLGGLLGGLLNGNGVGGLH